MSEEKAYKTTKEDCVSKITGVCSQCGGKLDPIETVDNSNDPTFWAGCLRCHIFCWGIDERIFKLSDRMVREHDLRPYSHIDHRPDDSLDVSAYKLRQQVAGAHSLVRALVKLIEEETKQEQGDE
jgi:hypothetical protein